MKPNAYVRLKSVSDPRLGLPGPLVMDTMIRAMNELAAAETLVMFHGYASGIRRYYQHGGSVISDVNGDPWIAVEIPA